MMDHKHLFVSKNIRPNIIFFLTYYIKITPVEMLRLLRRCSNHKFQKQLALLEKFVVDIKKLGLNLARFTSPLFCQRARSHPPWILPAERPP